MNQSKLNNIFSRALQIRPCDPAVYKWRGDARSKQDGKREVKMRERGEQSSSYYGLVLSDLFFGQAEKPETDTFQKIKKINTLFQIFQRNKNVVFFLEEPTCTRTMYFFFWINFWFFSTQTVSSTLKFPRFSS